MKTPNDDKLMNRPHWPAAIAACLAALALGGPIDGAANAKPAIDEHGSQASDTVDLRRDGRTRPVISPHDLRSAIADEQLLVVRVVAEADGDEDEASAGETTALPLISLTRDLTGPQQGPALNR